MAEEEGDDYGQGYYRPPTLGELSRSLSYERGELAEFDLKGPGGVPPQGPGGPAAVADLNRATDLIHTTETQRISPRPPALLYQVISTYDSRPIQAYDFQSSSCDTLNWNGAPPTMDTAEIEYTVPSNVVAVLREFRYQVMNAPAANAVVEGDCWLQSDLFVNDLPVREYNQMLLPVNMHRPFPTFLIVDELNRIRLKLSTFDPDNTEFGALDGISSSVLFSFYGNLLLKTGVPVDFEIANAIGGGQL